MLFRSRPFKLARQFLKHLIPTQCLLCGSVEIDDRLCEGCLKHLPWQAHTCLQCGLALETDDRYCGHCLSDPPAFSQSQMPLLYQAPVSQLITQFKYQHQFAAGQMLSDLLAQHLLHQATEAADWRAPDLLIPVPVHWRKRWSRGFNQAEFIAQQIARHLKIPIHRKIVAVLAHQHSQKGLNREDRQKNLRGKFAINEKYRSLIHGKYLAIVDDVVTTTATTRELSKTLMKAGAARVDVWALARTPEYRG